VLVTQGQEGMSLFRHDGTIGHFPTAAKEVFDVTGGRGYRGGHLRVNSC